MGLRRQCRLRLEAAIPWILAGAMTLVVGCASGGIGNPEGWTLMQSQHFNVYVGAPRHATQTLAELEYAHAAFSSSFFRGVDVPKTDVLFLEEADFQSLVGFRRKEMILAKLPSKDTQVGADGLIILEDTTGDHGINRALAHLFIEKKFPHAPLWFHQGFSSYARTLMYRRGDNNAAACFGTPSGGSHDTLIPLDKLGSLSWDDYDGDEARSWYDYTGRTLFDYVLHGEGGKNKERIGPLVGAMASGGSLTASINAAFPGITLAALDKQLGEHQADVVYHLENATKVRGLCPIPFVVPPDKFADQGERKMSPANPADIKAMLEAIKKLPRLDGYPGWYPPEVIAKVGG
jgi:hypothetical protein